jgi:hypothetical protein
MTIGVDITPTVGGINDQSPAGSLKNARGIAKVIGRTSGC